MEVGSIYAKVDADLTGFHRGMTQVNRDLNQTRGRTSSAFGAMGKAAAVGGLAVAAGIGFGLKKSIQSANDHAVALALTEAHLKSTGDASGKTAQQITSFADAMEKSTGVDDLAVQAGQNMLLTFTQIKGNFDEATTATVDLATSMNNGLAPSQEEVSKTAILVGKALQDPEKGLAALHRVGVDFTESQKDTVKAMIDVGDTAGAQKVILKELETEVGGSANAFGKTLPGQLQIAKAHLDDVAQHIGDKLVPALSNATTWVSDHWPQISAVFNAVFAAIHVAWTTVLKPALDALIAGGEMVVAWTKAHWPEISDIIHTAMGAIRDIVTGVVNILKAVWEIFGGTITAVARNAFDFIKTFIREALDIIVNVFKLAGDLLHGRWGAAWDDLKEIVSSAGRIIVAAIEMMVKNMMAVIREIPHMIETALGDLSHLLWNAGSSIIQGLIDGLKSRLGEVENLASSIGGKIKSLKGPIEKDRVLLYPEGQAIIEGLHAGMDNRMGGLEHGVAGYAGAIQSAIPTPSGGSGGGSYVFNFPNYVGARDELVQLVYDGLVRKGLSGGALLTRVAGVTP